MSIDLAASDDEIAACFDVMAELRPALKREEFVARVRRQMAGGYQLAALRDDAGRVVSVAGFRFAEMLAWGRHLYVDDLVTAAAARSRGHGERLFQWLCDLARARGCAELHLDSGVQRFGAHRFYLQQRMRITSHHFALDLNANVDSPRS